MPHGGNMKTLTPSLLVLFQKSQAIASRVIVNAQAAQVSAAHRAPRIGYTVQAMRVRK
jgi:hypothetical protein